MLLSAVFSYITIYVFGISRTEMSWQNFSKLAFYSLLFSYYLTHTARTK